MLETVKEKIQTIEDIPFSEFFARYVQEVQDRNIEGEIASLCRQNTLNIYIMDRLIHESLEELRT